MHASTDQRARQAEPDQQRHFPPFGARSARKPALRAVLAGTFLGVLSPCFIAPMTPRRARAVNPAKPRAALHCGRMLFNCPPVMSAS